ncbi:hypothetical protein HGA92_00690 [Candidatus Gracilibacteria bacterium]|nr:hypothetical protein [Candidatus Gracilibacteria bacterium]NUJ98874.1 hypothetical protein [Candidatus Gracilibacteria bacterium]
MFKKIILFSLFFFFSSSFAYGANYTVSSGLVNCSEYPIISNVNGHKFILSSINTSASTSGSFTCEEHGYWSGYRSSWISLNTHFSCPNDEYASQIEYSGSNYRIFCKYRDDTPPTEGDLIINPTSGTGLLANNSQNFQINIGNNGGAPINYIETRFENWNTINSLLAGNFISLSPVLNMTVSTQNVDNDRQANGSREYTLDFINVCDEAGNCTNTLSDRNYPIYANSTNLGVADVTTNEIDDLNNVADGSTRDFTITLKDVYGNNIVLATGINRTIDFNFNTNNTLYLNQYTRSGDSSVFTSIPNSGTFSNRFPLGNGIITSFNGQNSSNGNYNFGFNVYTPTYQTYMADPNGRFDINSISSDINGILGANSGISINNSSTQARFNPLYNTTFSGELVTYGFMEGTVQRSQVGVSKNAFSLNNGNLREIYLEYGSGARESVPRLKMSYSQSGNPTNTMGEGNPNYTQFISPSFSVQDYPLRTKIIQGTGSISDLNKTYLSSHIRYELDGHDVIYNSDIIGKGNYWEDLVANNNTYQVGLKILGIGSSKNNGEIITDQFANDLKILGNIYKSSLKKDVTTNAYSTIKSVTPINGTSPYQINELNDFSLNSDGTKLKNNSILYFGNINGARVDLGDGNETASGSKTIIIEGGNLYIRNNIRYANSNSILGIIVLKDANGNGGNIYIDPSVTRIDATIFTERSIVSYDGTNIIDGDADADVLNNQLFIFGTVFSENTIGGSRTDPLKCPYYISSLSCTVTNAQIYDLNYLRRYYIYDSDGDGDVDNSDVAANGGINYAGTFNVTSYPYARYPVVINYNPLLASFPPPLFTK